jgi:hypothetical protein
MPPCFEIISYTTIEVILEASINGVSYLYFRNAVFGEE